MSEPLGQSLVCSPMRIHNGCFINSGGMPIANMFNNKIDDLILFWVVELVHPTVECSCTWQYQTFPFV
jgi:hypothetical protein